MTDVVTAIAELQHALTAALDRVAQLEGRHERMFRKGKVTDVDAKKQLYRQVVGTDPDGQDVKSPWIPYGQIAGALKIHSPPTVGQQMMLVSPDGDFPQAFGLPYTWSDDNPSPSDKGDNHVITFAGSNGKTRYSMALTTTGIAHQFHDSDGKVRSVVSQSADTIGHVFKDGDGAEKSSVTLTATSVKTKVGDVAHELTKDGQKNTGGKMSHDGKDIGKTHKHGGIEPGAAQTDVPEPEA